MTIEEALQHGRFRLQSTSVTPDLDARLLLQYVLDRPYSYLVAHDDEGLSPAEETRYKKLVTRAAQGEPIPYLTGQAAFYGLDFLVNPAVLIPRPETEQLVEQVIRWAQPRHPLTLVDVGTGSGCIAIALAQHLPQATIAAVDVSPEALALARENARRLVPGRIRFYEGHLLSPLSHKVDVITANLPYVADTEWTELEDGVKWYEPSLALRGGPDGLELIRPLLQQATTKLHPGGAIFLEIGWKQGTAVTQLAASLFVNASIDLIADYAGRDRIVIVQT